jgi:hypothetical protein
MKDVNDTIRRWENVIERMGELDHPNNLPKLFGNVE